MCILDAPEERIDQALDLYMGYFLAEEPFSLASGNEISLNIHNC